MAKGEKTKLYKSLCYFCSKKEVFLGVDFKIWHRMVIANPMYDVVFKRMMENDRVAKFFKGFSKELKTQNPKYINFQQIRTSVITKWLKQYNLRQVQYMAGHRYISSTEAYLVNQIEDLQTDVDKFHPF